MANQHFNVLACIRDYDAEHGYGPTVREICEVVGLASTSTVHGHLTRLQRQGYITWQPEKVRTLKLTEAGEIALSRTQ